MRIVLATPLYPPDIENPAPYIKELAKRLANKHTITVVAYGHLPEQVSGVDIVTINKLQPVFARLFAYIKVLYQIVKNADVLYAENGPSVELPVALVSLATRTPLIMHIGDSVAHKKASTHLLLRIIEKLAQWRANTIIIGAPLDKPEIIPLEPTSSDDKDMWDASWKNHLKKIEDAITYVY